MAIVGGRPSISSMSGFCSWSKNCRAYVESDSMYFRCPSANTVSNASVLLPLPLRPVTTTSWSRGMSTETFLRLCSRAPRILMCRDDSADDGVLILTLQLREDQPTV